MFECTFCGFQTESRQTFRRHLTSRHDADCRYEKDSSGRFRDIIVILSGAELASRVAALRKGQRHVRRRTAQAKAAGQVVIPAVAAQVSAVSACTRSSPAETATRETPADCLSSPPVNRRPSAAAATNQAGPTHGYPAAGCSSPAPEFDLGGGVSDFSVDREYDIVDFPFADDLPTLPPVAADEPYRVPTPVDVTAVVEVWPRGAVGGAPIQHLAGDPPALSPPPVTPPSVHLL